MGWTPSEFWKSSVVDFVAAWNARCGKTGVDLSGLDESADAIERMLEERDAGN